MLFERETAKMPAITITEQIKQYLTDNSFRYDLVGDYTIKTPIKGKHVSWYAYVKHDEERKLITIHSVLPMFAGDIQKLKIADLLNRLNYSCMLGKWTMDNEDGEISHVTSFLAETGCFLMEHFDIIFHTNLSSVDKFFPALASVNFGNTEPALAYNSIS